MDRWPSGLPSNIWAQGQVIVDEYEFKLPSDIEPGNYSVAVGLYDAENGQRLLAADAVGAWVGVALGTGATIGVRGLVVLAGGLVHARA